MRSRVSERTAKSAMERKYERERVRRKRIYCLIILLVTAAIFFVLCITVFFNISVIKVQGSTNYTADEIAAASGIKVGDNMLRTDAEECSQRIVSQLVYVETAEVKKIFPNTVQLTVEASVPHANVQTLNGYYLISKKGKVLEKLSNSRPGLLTINGAEADITLEQGDMFRSVDEDKTNDIFELIDAFDKYDLANVTFIDITDRANTSFLYDSRIVVELGVVSELDYKLKFAGEILTKDIGMGTAGRLRLLPDNSAQFIDEAGLEEIDRIYEQNIATSVNSDFTEPEETETNEDGEPVETTAPQQTEEETSAETTTVFTVME